MPHRLSLEERQVRNRFDRALTGIKNNISELAGQIASIEADLKQLKPLVLIYKRDKTTRVKSRVVFLQMKVAIQKLADDPKERATEWTVLCRQIGNFIFDISAIWTGYESEALTKLREEDPDVKECNEHFFPRQRAGEFIAKSYLHNDQMTLSRFYTLINRFRLTHKTTSDENDALRKAQRRNKSLFNWRKNYADAGVVLQKRESRPFLLTTYRRQVIKELLSALEYYQGLKRAMVAERVSLNKTLKRRKKLYQQGITGPSEMVTLGENPLNTISVEGDESFTYDSHLTVSRGD